MMSSVEEAMFMVQSKQPIDGGERWELGTGIQESKEQALSTLPTVTLCTVTVRFQYTTLRMYVCVSMHVCGETQVTPYVHT